MRLARDAGLRGVHAGVLANSAAAEALRHGPRGAFFVAGISTALLFVGWLAFYFLLFMPRGSVG